MEMETESLARRIARLVAIYTCLGAGLFAIVSLWVFTGMKLWGKHTG